jgi:hypothetical protein
MDLQCEPELPLICQLRPICGWRNFLAHAQFIGVTKAAK